MEFNGDISQWNVSKEADLCEMFEGSVLKKSKKIPKWYKK